MKRLAPLLNRVLVFSPWATAVLLIGMASVLPNRSAFNPDAERRKAAVAAAMSSAPYFIDRWVGEEAAHLIPPEAQTLLQPNAILSRTYRSPAGPDVQVMIVHCGDARDMIGHHPPICYPSTGWRQIPSPAPMDIALSVAGRPLPVRQYGFECVTPEGRAQSIRIFSAFVLPDGRVVLDIDDINRQSERLALAVQGVAQLQVITSCTTPLPEAVAAADEILGGMTGVFDALQLGGNRSGLAGASDQLSPQGASRETRVHSTSEA